MVPKITVTLLGLSFLLGVLITWLGLRGRRVNRLPVCRACKFDLSGLPADAPACPECGRDLAARGAVQIGQRRKMVLVAGLGALMIWCAILPVGLLTIAAALGRDVNVYKPTWLLVAESGWSEKTAADAIAKELFDRMITNKIPKENYGPLVDAALAIQADPSDTWSSEWGRIIERAMTDKVMTAEQLTSYEKHAFRFRVETRDMVERSGEIPIFLVLDRDRSIPLNMTIVPVWIDEIKLAGRKLDRVTRSMPAAPGTEKAAETLAMRQPAGMIMMMNAARGMGKTAHEVSTLASVPADLPAGWTTLEVQYSYKASDMSSVASMMSMGVAMSGIGTPESRGTHAISTKLKLVNPGEDVITVLPGSEQTAARGAGAFRDASAFISQMQTDPGMLGAVFGAKRQPPSSMLVVSFYRADSNEKATGSAYDVYLREGEQLTLLGPVSDASIASAEMMSSTFGMFSGSGVSKMFPRRKGSFGKTLNLVLKPSERAARRTRSLTIISGDIIELKDVEVR